MIYIVSLVLVIAVGVLAPLMELVPLRVLPWWPWLWGVAAAVVAVFWLIGPRPLHTFNVPRGDKIQHGDLKVYGGAVDVHLGKTRRPALLTGQTSLYDDPQWHDIDHTTMIALSSRWYHLLNFNDWQLYLNSDVIWKLTLEGSLGNVSANLRDLQVRQASMVTDLGDVQVATPNNGVTSLHISTTIGDITVRVPEGVAVEVRIDAGDRCLIRLDTKRFNAVGEGRWRSPDYDDSVANRLALTIETTRGDVTVV